MATSTSVDASLWWDPFSLLLTDLENTSLTSTKLPPKLMEKLEENHAWFVETVSLFKKPNEKSRAALNFQQVKIGSHSLSIQSELKDKALKFSSYLCLDEVQSYILVERYIQDDNVASGSLAQELLHMVLLEYYIERQCLLKCTRHILLHALYVGNGSKEGDVCAKALKLVNDGLESKLISVLQCLLSSTHPEQMDVDLFTFWAEETLAEENLILDILFVAYYESFCRCNGERWRILCLLYKGIICGSYNIEMLAISTTAMHSSYQVKVRLLLILMETLDLENLLQAVHDEATFRKGASVFTSSDFQEMDAIVSGLNAFEIKEAGPLVLTWAVYLCLLSSLPGKEEHNVLLEIDHVGYVRQAFDSASFNYFLELLHSDLLKESEGLIVGYRSVLRTFVSAFIASYEINLQVEDTTLCSILDILCNIYRGEESLCTQFWDRESFIDGPIRCLLCDLEGEFPSRIVEFIRLLSSLCEGSWPAECVYNFLDKSVGISSLFEISSRTLMDAIPEIVETQQPLPLLGMEGLLIPSKTRGHVLKVVNRNTVLVRWELYNGHHVVGFLHIHLEADYPENLASFWVRFRIQVSMRNPPLSGRALLLCFFWLSFLFAATLCHATEKTVEVVGDGECAGCEESGIKNSHAFSGLKVAIDCKPTDGHFKTRGIGELDEGGKFTVLLPHAIVNAGKLKEECYAQLYSASASPCPAHDGLQSSKVVFMSKTEGKHTFGLSGKLKFSPVTCTSAFLWPFFKHPPLPKFPKFPLPLPLIPKFPHPHFKHFGPPFSFHPLPPKVFPPKPFFPPVYKKPLPPLAPIYQKPIPPPVPIYVKPLPPPVPIYKKPLPPPVPIYVKPLPPPVPIYKKPLPPPVPIYKKPLPPPVPVYKKPLPPPVPVYKKPLPPPVPIYKKPPVPIYKKPLPPPVPIYKKPLPPPVPIYKKPLPPPVPIYKKPLPPPVPIYKKPLPPPVPIYKKPLPPPVPIYKKPLPPPVPIYKKPLPPPIPIYKKPLPPPIPIYKKPLPPSVPIYIKPLPPSIPIYKPPFPKILPPPVPIYVKPLPPPIPFYKFKHPFFKPLPPFPKIPHHPFFKKPWPPIPHFPPLHKFPHPKFGSFPTHPPFDSHP